MRRALVLIRGLPPGACVYRRMGGDRAWSYEERATREAGWLVQSAVIGTMGGKKAKAPPRPEPPPEGWWERREATIAKERRKVAHLRRKQEAAARRAAAMGTQHD